METDWFEDFMALLDAGSFSKAAENRRLSQPAFGRRIKALEDWVGTPLVVRGTHTLTPTAAGKHLSSVTSELLRRITSARTELMELAATNRAEIKLASTPALAQTFFSSWIRGIETVHMPASMSLSVDSMTACERSLMAASSHFVICHHHQRIRTPLESSQFDAIKLADDALLPLCSPAMAAARPESNEIRFLNYTPESGLHRVVESERADRLSSLKLRQVFTSPSSMVLAAMAREGHGMAWLPAHFAADDLAAGKLVLLGSGAWSIPLAIRLVRAKARLCESAEIFWRVILQRYGESSR
ncbi:LysR substrate-binding domain-containing protein [Caballeronia sp. LP003]|uniref:LysR family transcriptional regulator n=1 Tax=Caballeronia sp. LP003 TaxID=3038551 RepID=UPI002856A6A1|nr:LysR substrate-binding domain-containing protein [Caballeronia sp. LP003]MDR5785451.1 LysR substrate-binding domain-containing protein [Caballeronia sp. LP003]